MAEKSEQEQGQDLAKLVVDFLEFMLRDRSDWFNIGIGQNQRGSWDVLLRLDGSYVDKRTAKEVSRYFRREMRPMLGNKRLPDWDEQIEWTGEKESK